METGMQALGKCIFSSLCIRVTRQIDWMLSDSHNHTICQK